MSTAFWLSGDELDEDQVRAVETVGEKTSFILRGPAGSGKTNILLLRAKWLIYKKLSNFKIIVFTGSLRDFIGEGCLQYGIDPNSAVTQMTFFREILTENGVPFSTTGDFQNDRTQLAGKVMALIEKGLITEDYCSTLFVDEAQDYTDTELIVFRKLCRTLVLAMDSRQSIYLNTHTPELAEKLVDNNIVNLNYHYRSGLKLCKVADAILAGSSNSAKVQEQCRYPESKRPSSITQLQCENFDLQINSILTHITNQIDLYPDEKLGVLFPKREQAEQFKASFIASSITDKNNQVWIDTLHGAKGREFRAVHIGGLEVLARMGAVQKRLIYTGILRGKTSAQLYFSGHLPSYLDAALATIEPPRPNPALGDLFKR
jgi:superfamily I DNA/RNA helicase